MIFARRTDSNHKAIVERLRQCGMQVIDCSRVGGGFPDLMVNFLAKTHLVEVKSKRGKLTKDQVRFHGEWRGPPIVTLRTLDECDGFFQRCYSQSFK